MPAVPPESTKVSLQQRLSAHAREHWPAIGRLDVRFRGRFAYLDAHLADQPDATAPLSLCRLRYGGSAHLWGFAIWRASHDDYADSVLPDGSYTGTPQDALDTAATLYIGSLRGASDHRRTSDDDH